MTNAELAWLGGGLGAILGLIGGIVGTYFSIKNSKKPKQRTFAIKMSVIGWAAILTVSLVAYILPDSYKMLAFIPIWIGLPFYILYWNRKQKELGSN